MKFYWILDTKNNTDPGYEYYYYYYCSSYNSLNILKNILDNSECSEEPISRGRVSLLYPQPIHVTLPYQTENDHDIIITLMSPRSINLKI